RAHEPGARLHRRRAHLGRASVGPRWSDAHRSRERLHGQVRGSRASFSCVIRQECCNPPTLETYLRSRWPMRVTRVILPVALCAVVLAPIARATCPPSCAIPGGSNPALDCQAEFAAPGLRLNYPAFDPAHPKPGKEVRCFDGDAGCDLDDAADHACVFDVDVCLRNSDPALPACTPADVTSVSVSGTSRDPELAALQSALSAL